MHSLIDAELAEWEATIPAALTRDLMWKSVAYRLGLFAQEWVIPDLERLEQVPRATRLLDQLSRASESISSNFSEGYGRPPGRDRVRFYEYSLSSARESRDAWFKVRRYLDHDRYLAGLELFTRLVQILTAVVRKEKAA